MAKKSDMTVPLAHQIKQDGDLLVCEVCQRSWRKLPGYGCPGVRQYDWGAAPEQLKTERQWRAAGRRVVAGSAPVGCLYYGQAAGGYLWLYEAGQTEPMPARTERQLAADERRRLMEQMRRTCPRCGREQAERLLDVVCEACGQAEMLELARITAVKFARELLGRADWVILDTETTGLDYGSEIVQIAILEPATGREYGSLVRPRQPIPPEATAVHGITDEMVADAPTWAQISDEVVSWCAGKFVIAYNADFDMTMLGYAQESWGLYRDAFALFPEGWGCAMEQYAAFVGEWSEYFGDFKFQPLPGGDHTALGDCRATLALIRTMAA